MSVLGAVQAWLRPLVLLGSVGLTLALVPREPARPPFDPRWREAVARQRPRTVVLGNCLTSWFDEQDLARADSGRAALLVSVPGSLAAEWHALLQGAVFGGHGTVDTVVLPFVGQEFAPEAMDRAARQRALRWLDPAAPVDPAWEALRDSGRSAPERLGERVEQALFRPSVWAFEAELHVPLAAQWLVMGTAAPEVADALRTRLGAQHFRPGEGSLDLPTSRTGDTPEEQVRASALPLLAAQVQRGGARLVLVRLPAEGPGAAGAEALGAAALSWAADNGVLALDTLTEPALAAEVDQPPTARRTRFSRWVGAWLQDHRP